MIQDQNIILKTSIEVHHIRKSCEVVSTVLQELSGFIQPGISLLAIENFCEKIIQSNGSESAIKGYNGFPGSVCISLNNVAAHGIASNAILEDGDVVTIDCAVIKNGWHGDGALTYLVGSTHSISAERIVRAAKEAVRAGILAAKAGSRLGDIGHAIEKTSKRYKCAILKNFVGHGIGRSLHEDPKVYHFGDPGVGQPLVPGMVFTIEPILSLGSGEVKLLDDGWSLVSADNSLCAQFEYTIAIFGSSTEVLILPDSL